MRLVSSESRQILTLTKWGRLSWMCLHFLVSGTWSLITVRQPAVVSTALGRDVIMPCQFEMSHDEKLVRPPVLYWLCSSRPDSPKLWPSSDEYEGRVGRLDSNDTSSNKSILFKNVQWADSGKYLCKLSVSPAMTKSFRTKGNETSLMVYENMIFNLTSHNDSRLQCEANVSREPGCVLSIFHNGCKLPSVGRARGQAVADLPYVTLSESVSATGGGTYECQLHVNDELVTKSVFHHHLAGDDAGRNVSTACSTMASGLMLVLPEPWILYIALLLVPITFLLGIVTARVMFTS